MEQPILSVAKHEGSTQKVTPNVLPCRVHHDGPIGAADAYWTPTQEPDGSKVAYFRGRKLHGKALKVPENYRGVVVERRAAPKPQASRTDEPEVIDVDVDVDAEDEMPIGVLETQAEFDEMVVWGHESIADAASDPYLRGVEEWTMMAEQIHSYDVKDN